MHIESDTVILALTAAKGSFIGLGLIQFIRSTHSNLRVGKVLHAPAQLQNGEQYIRQVLTKALHADVNKHVLITAHRTR